jgi:carboxyl-terminal processing protease
MSRPLALWTTVVAAFAAGVLIERYQYLLVPDHAPPGVEKTFRPFWEVWNLADRYYVDHSAVQPERMTHGAIHGMLASLGDVGHTSYRTKSEFAQEESRLAGNMEGIGAMIGLRERRPTIVSTFSGSPARAAGLKGGDVLLEVDGKSVGNLALDRITSMVRGAPGTTVKLRIQRKGEPKALDLAIARATVDVPDVTWRLLPGLPIAHIAIESFGKQAHSQLKEALAGAKRQGARGLILDVRADSGGFKEQAVAVASEFLKDGDVFIERDGKDHRTPVAVVPGGTALDIPVCVLIDIGTASSAEIFAGAIQDHGRGKLIGTRTFGTGTVLQPFRLSDDSVVLLAVYEWLTPNGRSIWRQGIVPDINVALPADAFMEFPEQESHQTAEELAKSPDKQLLKGIEALKGVLGTSAAGG